MDYRSIFAISAAGMDLEKKRLELATLNMANMNASVAPGTTGYQALRAVTTAVNVQFADLVSGSVDATNARQVGVVQVPGAPRWVSDPGHPHANERGMVQYPNINQATEMVTAMTALRAYEANVVAAGMARTMVSRALEIGGQS